MATTQINQQISQAEQLIQDRSSEAQKVRQGITKYQQSLPDPSAQSVLRAKPSQNPLTRLLQRRKIERAQKQASQALQEVDEYQEGLQEYQRTKIDPVKSELKDYESVMGAYRKGKLWAVAAFESGRKQEIAQEMIKRGYDPALGGELSIQEYQKDLFNRKLNKDLKSFSNEDGSVTLPLDYSYEGKNLDQLQKEGYIKFEDEQPTTTSIKEYSIKGTAQNQFIPNIPNIQTNVVESYNPRIGTSGAYVSQSPTGPSSTAFIRPPTPEEFKQLEKVNVQPSYFGDYQITPYDKSKSILFPTKSTAFDEGGGLPDVRLIQPDYSRGFLETAEQYVLPSGASIPLTLSNERVYLPDTKSQERFNELLQSPALQVGENKDPYAREFQLFLRDQQAQKKKDIGRYNLLTATMGSDPSEEQVREINILVDRINKGDRGTLDDITFQSTRGTRTGELLYGGLTGAKYAYSGAKTALAFELGAGALGKITTGMKFGGLTGSPLGLKTLRYTTLGSGITLGTSFGALAGAKEFSKRGDVLSGIGAGVGTVFGLYGGRTLKGGVDYFTSPRYEFKDLTLSQYKKLRGFDRNIRPQEISRGRITTQTNRWNDIFRSKVSVSNKGIKFIKADPLYSGSPFGKGGKKAYQEALARGVKFRPEKEVKELLRLRKPRYAPEVSVSVGFDEAVLIKPKKIFSFKGNTPIREFNSKLAPDENLAGFTVKSGRFKGNVFVREGLPKKLYREVIAHEQGHIFVDQFGSNLKVTKKEALKYLLKKYDGVIPKNYKSGNAAINEYLADIYAGKVAKYNILIQPKTKLDIYSAKGTATSKIIDPFTKRIKERKTEVFSTLTADQLDDSVKIVSTSQISSPNFRKFSVRSDLKIGETVAFIKNEPTKLGFLEGTAKTKVKDLGTFRTSVRPDKVTSSLRIPKLRPEYESLSNLKLKLGETLPGKKTFDLGRGFKGTIKGERTEIISTILTETTKTKRPVLSYIRDGKKVKGYLKDYRGLKIDSTNLGTSRTSVFTPIDNVEDGVRLVTKKIPLKTKVKTVLDSQTAAIKDVIKADLKPKPITFKTPTQTETSVKTLVPLIVGGSSQSLYTGSGEYERTLVGPIIKAKDRTLVVDKPQLDTETSQDDFNVFGSSPTKDALDLGQVPTLNQPEREDTSQREDTRQSEGQAQRTEQQLITLTTLVPTSLTSTSPRTRTSTNVRPKKGGIFFFSISDGLTKRRKTKSGKDKDEKFLAITKRKGKEVILGVTRTPQKAEQLAKRTVLQTLAATAKVKSTKGRQVRLKPDKLFRTSKTDPLAIVQRKSTPSGGRLGSFGERREIKQSRKPFSLL